MSRVFIRFYADLNELLPRDRRARAFAFEFTLPPSIKDLIESFGVPHTEVDLLLANGEPVDFAYVIGDGDRISVYPPFKAIDVASVTRVRPPALDGVRFVLDIHLGKLAALLRLLGFDTLYRNDYGDDELARISARESRILLTRDRGLLMRNAVVYGYSVRRTEPRRQLVEVIARFDLAGRVAPFRRCLRCNGLLEVVDKAAILDRLPTGVRELHDAFHICRDCRRVYWPGTHYRRLRAFVDEIAADLRAGA
jgi:uncharacterized protein with PIN domain